MKLTPELAAVALRPKVVIILDDMEEQLADASILAMASLVGDGLPADQANLLVLRKIAAYASGLEEITTL